MTPEALAEMLAALLVPCELLLAAMETCHICSGTVLVGPDAINCEDCSPDCDGHDEPACVSLLQLHSDAKRAIPALLRHLSEQERDTKRLDYVQDHGLRGAVIWKGQSDLGWLMMGQTTTYGTLREAIDAAMEKNP